MRQLDLFNVEGTATTPPIVNVASVPKRSPFRYPGGKTWLIPRVREWLRAQPSKPKVLLEPFAGGGIVGLTVAFEELAEQVVLVELDEDVAAVWQTIIADGEGPWLADKITSFLLSGDTVTAELAKQPGSIRERAWKTILKNRVQRGGILAPGAGLIRFGEAGRGLASRWYPQTLARRILEIHRIRARLSFRQGDGLEVMREYAARADTAIFIDPPYTAGGKGKRAGTRLYAHNELDHEALFALTQQMAGDVLMTYDDDREVRALATAHGLSVATVPMKSTHHAVMRELIIGRKLEWLGYDGTGTASLTNPIQQIVLVSCASQKQSQPCRAEALYTSALFRKNLAYARSLRPDAIYILSAQYGLVGLDTVIEPYDLTLNNMSAAERKSWAQRVLQQLGAVASLSEDHFIFLAGDKYRAYLLPHIRSYDVPLEGMPIGKQLQALTALTTP